MIDYDANFRRLFELMDAHGAVYTATAFWHRWKNLPRDVRVSVESKARTVHRLNVFVSFEAGVDPAPPEWAIFREHGRGLTKSPGMRIRTGPHHKFSVKTKAQMDELLAYLDRLLQMEGH